MKIKRFILRRLMASASWLLPRNRTGDIWFSRFNYFAIHRKSVENDAFNNPLFLAKHSKFAYSAFASELTCKSRFKSFLTSHGNSELCVQSLQELNYPVTSDVFPDRCVIKPSHTSGHVIIRKNGEPLDLAYINSWQHINHYLKTREPNYRNLTPKIIIEEILFDNENLTDYKFFCLKDQVLFIQLDFDRHTNHTRIFLDRNWEALNCSSAYLVFNGEVQRPENSVSLNKIAGEISSMINSEHLIRIDLYSDG